MEKLLFWNDIYSKVNRHADKGRLLEKESIFTVYPIIFIYEIFSALENLGENLSLSKFELEHFVFFARNHDQVEEVFENIIDYRRSKNIFELEKFLKKSVRTNKSENKFNIFDSRFFSILKNLDTLKWSPDSITLKEEKAEEVFDKVSKFSKIKKISDIFPKENYEDYRKMLYSGKNLFEYFSE